MAHHSASYPSQVTAIVYAAGEIINGCIVRNRDQNGILICSTDMVSIMMAPHPMLTSITKDQIISVRVGTVRYHTGTNKVAINAIRYLFDKTPLVYKIGPITSNDRELPIKRAG